MVMRLCDSLLWGLCFALLLSSPLFAQRAGRGSCLKNGDLELGTLDGWSVRKDFAFSNGGVRLNAAGAIDGNYDVFLVGGSPGTGVGIFQDAKLGARPVGLSWKYRANPEVFTYPSKAAFYMLIREPASNGRGKILHYVYLHENSFGSAGAVSRYFRMDPLTVPQIANTTVQIQFLVVHRQERRVNYTVAIDSISLEDECDEHARSCGYPELVSSTDHPTTTIPAPPVAETDDSASSDFPVVVTLVSILLGVMVIAAALLLYYYIVPVKSRVISAHESSSKALGSTDQHSSERKHAKGVRRRALAGYSGESTASDTSFDDGGAAPTTSDTYSDSSSNSDDSTTWSDIVFQSSATSSGEDEDSDTSDRPYLWARLVARHPFLMCALQIATPITLAAIAVSFPLEIDYDISSFRIQDHEAADRYDALRGAREDYQEERSGRVTTDDRRPGLQTANLTQDVSLPLHHPEWSIDAIYLADDDMFEPDRVQVALEFANSFQLELDEFDDYCWIAGSNQPRSCALPDSLLPILYAGHNSSLDISHPQAKSPVTLSQSEIDLGIEHALRVGLYGFADEDWGPTQRESSLMRIRFNLGSPLPGFNSRDEDVDEQEDKVRTWQVKKALPYLQEYASGSSVPDGVKFFFGSKEMMDEMIMLAFYSDLTLCLVAIAAVVLLMALVMRSCFLALIGMAEITLCFPVAYFVYRVLAGIQTVNVLLGASIFVVIGIGVDDLFVFYNQYTQAEFVGSQAARLSQVYRRAGVPTLITSATTAAAFAANAFSPIPALRTFGWFTAVLVGLNYLLAVSVFPCVLVIWSEKWTPLWNTQVNRCRCDLTALNSFRIRVRAWKDSMRGNPRPYERSLYETPGDLDSLGFLEHIFLRRWAPLVIRGRYLIIALATVILGLAVWQMFALEAADSPPRFFRDGSNLQQLIDWYQEGYFTSGVREGNSPIAPIRSNCPNPWEVRDVCGICGGDGASCAPPNTTSTSGTLVPTTSTSGTSVPTTSTSGTTIPTTSTSGTSVPTTSTTTSATSTSSTSSTGTSGTTGMTITTMSTTSTTSGGPSASTSMSTGSTTTLGTTTTGVPISSASTSTTSTSTSASSGTTSTLTSGSTTSTTGTAGSTTSTTSGITTIGLSSTGQSTISMSSASTGSSGVSPTTSAASGRTGNPPTTAMAGSTGGCTIDRCNVSCGSNACLGCDGLPNSGLTFDICGICGGDGLSCFPEKPLWKSQLETVSLVWGIKGISRSSEKARGFNVAPGEVVYDDSLDLTDPAAQIFLMKLNEQMMANEEFVSPSKNLLTLLAEDLARAQLTWPIADANYFLELMQIFASSRKQYKNDIGFEFGAAGKPTRIKYLVVRYYAANVPTDIGSQDGEKEWVRWNDLVDEINTDAPGGANKAFQSAPIWLRVFTELAAIRGIGIGLAVAAAISVAALLLFTANVIISLIGSVVLAINIVCAMALFPVAGWKFGIVEALSVMVMVGLCVDYVFHVCEAIAQHGHGVYSATCTDNGAVAGQYLSRSDRVIVAMTQIGPSVFEAALTTITATLPLLAAQIVFFVRFGAIICFTLGVCVILSLTLLPALLSLLGPKGQHQGSLLHPTHCLHAGSPHDQLAAISRTKQPPVVSAPGSLWIAVHQWMLGGSPNVERQDHRRNSDQVAVYL